METQQWYAALIKPTWAPPAWVFGPVWTVLYCIIAISFGYVFYKIYQGSLSYWIGLPFILNLIFNAAFSPLQFNLKSNTLASTDILLVLITLVWAMYVIYPHFKWIALVNIPYFIWVLFATVLQLTITYLNW